MLCTPRLDLLVKAIGGLCWCNLIFHYFFNTLVRVYFFHNRTLATTFLQKAPEPPPISHMHLWCILFCLGHMYLAAVQYLQQQNRKISNYKTCLGYSGCWFCLFRLKMKQWSRARDDNKLYVQDSLETEMINSVTICQDERIKCLYFFQNEKQLTEVLVLTDTVEIVLFNITLTVMIYMAYMLNSWKTYMMWITWL